MVLDHPTGCCPLSAALATVWGMPLPTFADLWPPSLGDAGTRGPSTTEGFAWFGQPDRAQLFFPRDDLADQAPFSSRATVPDGWTAGDNGAPRGRRGSTFPHGPTASPMPGHPDWEAGVG
jgi:hypothetical protein